jgi:tetratricopeptide (TPR) repeat protein
VALKDSLRLLIQAAREKEAQDLLPHVNDAPSTEAGRWMPKDTLAHLASWRRLNGEELEAIRVGTSNGVTLENTDEINARTYAATHQLPAADVLEQGQRSWDAFAAAVEALTEEDLVRPRIRHSEQAAWQLVPGNTSFHLAEHLGYWHAEQGDEAAAEEAAIWGHDLEKRAFPGDARRQGMAAYNLGCFYAKRGRAAEALPLLRRGIELAPELREWANQDSDLDPIRSQPAVRELLAR